MVLHLEDDIVICVPFINNKNFSKKYDAKLTQIKLLTSLYKKVHDFITTNLLVLDWETH
jgi:hypothetical protein